MKHTKESPVRWKTWGSAASNRGCKCPLTATRQKIHLCRSPWLTMYLVCLNTHSSCIYCDKILLHIHVQIQIQIHLIHAHIYTTCKSQGQQGMNAAALKEVIVNRGTDPQIFYSKATKSMIGQEPPKQTQAPNATRLHRMGGVQGRNELVSEVLRLVRHRLGASPPGRWISLLAEGEWERQNITF